MNDDPYQPPSAPVSASYTSGDGQISPLALQHLIRTQPWVRLVSIVVLTVISIWLLTTIMGLSGSTSLAGARPGGAGEAGYFAGAFGVFLTVAVFYLYPLVKLSKYAAAIRRLRVSQSMADLENALDQQRGFWKFVGVVTLIGAVFALIGILGVFGALAGR